MMRTAQTYTKRVYDTPISIVIILMVMSVVLIVMSYYADSLTMFPSEKYGYYILTVVAIGITAFVSHGSVWGRKVKYGN